MAEIMVWLRRSRHDTGELWKEYLTYDDVRYEDRPFEIVVPLFNRTVWSEQRQLGGYSSLDAQMSQRMLDMLRPSSMITNPEPA